MNITDTESRSDGTRSARPERSARDVRSAAHGTRRGRGAAAGSRRPHGLGWRAWWRRAGIDGTGIRRWLPAVLALLLMLALIIGGWRPLSGFINPAVTELTLAASSPPPRWLNAEDLRQAAAGLTGRGFFNTDVRAVRTAVEAHPWVRRASVKRVWPRTLVVEVTERAPVARWGHELRLMTASAEVFAPVGIKPLASVPPWLDETGALPMLSGPDEFRAMVLQQYQALSRLLEPTGMTLTALSLSPRGSWRLELNHYVVVSAGREDVLNRVRRFTDLYISLPSSESIRIATADLRYPNGIAVSRVK